MAADGSIIIDTRIRTDGMEKGFDKIKDETQSVVKDANKAANGIQSAFSKIDVSKQVANAAAKVKGLEQQLAAVTSELKFAVADDDDRAAQRLAAKQISLYDRLEAAREKLSIEIAAAARKQAAEEEKAAQRSAKAAAKEAAAQERAAKKKLKAATKSAQRFSARLGSIASGALVFNVISAGLREVTEYFGGALKSNDQFSKSLAKLKGALLTAFQPIYEYALPAILKLMDIATKAAQAIAHIFAKLTGKSDAQMAKNAQALYEQAKAMDKLGESAKKAQKYLAPFDEITKVSQSDANSTQTNILTTTPNFEDFQAEDYQSKLEGAIVLTSMAMLAIGAVLAFSGANIPLGIGLMALGAAGLFVEITTNWSAIKETLQGPVGAVVAIVSGALLALGAILAFSGANIPLGIGLMLSGAVGLGTAVVANWAAIKEQLEGPIGAVTAILIGALLVIGAILAFSGVATPLGIGLIAVGAVGLATAAVANWDSIKGPIKSVLAGILSILSGAGLVLGVLLCLSGVGLPLGLALIAAGLAGSVTAWKLDDNPVTRFVKNMANGIINIINTVIDALNDMFHIKFDGLSISGVEIIPAFNTKLLSIPKIPMLAEGAVIPPNHKFLAMLGDQPSGTNIEAPLSTIQEAVALVMEDHFTGMMTGFEEMVAVLREILEAVYGIQIGDEVIAQAVNRYSRKINTAKGGA